MDMAEAANWRDRALKAEAWRAEFDTCMCGSLVDDHGIGSGHAPVSVYDYRLDQADAQITALEADLKYIREAARCVLDEAPLLVVKAIRQPSDAAGLETWTAAVSVLRAALQQPQASPGNRKDGEAQS